MINIFYPSLCSVLYRQVFKRIFEINDLKYSAEITFLFSLFLVEMALYSHSFTKKNTSIKSFDLENVTGFDLSVIEICIYSRRGKDKSNFRTLSSIHHTSFSKYHLWS